MIKIIFVCLGNICRSPLAEAICKYKINELGLENKMECDSAGTANYHIGKSPDPRSVKTSVDHGIPIKHLAQQFTKELAERFDYSVAMDYSNYQNMMSELGADSENLLLMRDFDVQNPGSDVPDPYYGGDDGFEEVYQILNRSVDSLLSSLIEKHDLQP